MSSDYQTYFSEKKINLSLRRVILASVGVTASAAFAISLLLKDPKFAKVSDVFGLVIEKKSNDNSATDLKFKYSSLNKYQQDDLVDLYIKEISPSQIQSIVSVLFKEKDPITSGPLALKMAMKAAERYKYDKLKIQVAFEYMIGVSLEKNFSEARKILELPSLETNPLAAYYRGIWWSDERNPSHNSANAEIHFKFAASKGIRAAEKALKTLAK